MLRKLAFHCACMLSLDKIIWIILQKYSDASFQVWMSDTLAPYVWRGWKQSLQKWVWHSKIHQVRASQWWWFIAWALVRDCYNPPPQKKKLCHMPCFVFLPAPALLFHLHHQSRFLFPSSQLSGDTSAWLTMIPVWCYYGYWAERFGWGPLFVVDRIAVINVPSPDPSCSLLPEPSLLGPYSLRCLNLRPWRQPLSLRCVCAYMCTTLDGCNDVWGQWGGCLGCLIIS